MINPSHAATTHDVSSEAIADRLISARAVIADLTHFAGRSRVISLKGASE